MVKQKDLIILGGGTGGYVAAIKAAQAGRQVTIIEKNKLGGTCLHNGCIPTKAMLKSAEVMEIANQSDNFGLEFNGELTLNYTKVLKRKESIINQLHQGVKALMKKNKIEIIEGTGVVQGPSIFTPDSGGVAVTYNDESLEDEIFVPKNLIIATGSSPMTLPNLPIDEKQILSSDGLLQLTELPKSMAIVGGGVIGCEWASILSAFGVEVTIVEALERLVPGESKKISKTLQRELENRQVTVSLKQRVKDAEVTDKSVKLSFENSDKSLEVDKVLVSIGRKPNVQGIGLKNTSIKFDENGIQVNDHYQTAESHIYAIGDVIDTLQLAHVAMKEGELAVEHMTTGDSEPINYINVPRCTYTHPEIATVGYTKDSVPKDMDVEYGEFSLAGNGKSLIEDQKTKGFVQILRDKDTEDLVGLSIIGPHATDLISEASTAMYLNATPIEIGEAIHAHPTISEAIAEAALDLDKLAIHK